jgi:hypothetical protein
MEASQIRFPNPPGERHSREVRNDMSGLGCQRSGLSRPISGNRSAATELLRALARLLSYPVSDIPGGKRRPGAEAGRQSQRPPGPSRRPPWPLLLDVDLG